MAIIPNDEQFIGTSSDVDMSEKKSSQVNSKTQVYTLQDFKDSVSSDGSLQIEGGVALDGTLRKVSDQDGNLSPLQLSTDEVGVSKSSTATTQDTAVIKSTDTNAGIAIVPNGTGAITAQVPDGTIANGGPRGDYAIDFQRARTTSLQGAVGSRSGIFAGYNHNVTSLAGVIAGGRNNIVTSQHGGVFTGQSNTAGSNSHATVVGGQSNTSSGQYSISGGLNNTASGISSVAMGNGNTATSNESITFGNNNTNNGARSVVSGGINNTLNGNQTVIGGGISNSTNGNYNVVAGGQSNNVSASSHSTVSGGEGNTASTNSHATVVGGYQNTSSGQYSVSGGRIANATNYGSVSFGQTCTASGYLSAAIGAGSTASGYAAVALGGGVGAGTRSVALGDGANCTGGDRSVAFVGGRVENGFNGSAAFGNSKTTSLAGFSFGVDSLSYLRNQFVQSPTNIYGGNVLYYGHSQASQVVALKSDTLTTGGTTVLSLDGTGTSDLIIPNGNNRVWNVVASWSAIVTGTSGTTTGVNVGDVITQSNAFAFKKIGGTSSIVGSVTDLATHSDSGMSSASMGYSAGASQELALTFTAPTFTGGGSVTLRIVNKIMLTEVAY